jgi:hypothetical protein
VRRVGYGFALAAALALPSSAGAQLPVGATMEGVEHVRNIPVNGSVGANFKGKYMFVTGTVGSPKTDPGLVSQMNYGGLWVYDISDGDNPQPVSHLPVPHYENEDVSIGGNRLLISGDGTLGGGTLVVVDITDPTRPMIEHVVKMYTFGGPGHTATCIQDCKYVWVAGGTSIYVLDLTKLDAAPTPVTGATAGTNHAIEVGDMTGQPEFDGTHDVQVDEAGYAWVVGGGGTIAFDTRPQSYGPGTDSLLNPTVVARTGPDALPDTDMDTIPGNNGRGDTVNDFIHHNSWRPDAAEFQSRKDQHLKKKGVNPGETVLITEEDIWNRATLTTKGGCETQGSFQTWQVKQLRTTGPEQSTMKHLDSFTTEFNELLAKEDDVDGIDMIPTNGFCSSHYFDEQDGLVATAWYEQGTRLLDTSDPTNIKQVGYFMAPDSVVWAAYWSPTDPSIVYVMDHQRGIDVLRVGSRVTAHRAKRVSAPAVPRWFRAGTKLSRKRLAAEGGRMHPDFGWVCRVRTAG